MDDNFISNSLLNEKLQILKNKINVLNSEYNYLIESIEKTLIIDNQIVDEELLSNINNVNIEIETNLIDGKINNKNI